MSSDELARFGDKLRTLRARRRLTLHALASELGLHTHSYLSELETSRKKPTAFVVLRVARFFEVSTDRLLKDELDLDIEGYA